MDGGFGFKDIGRALGNAASSVGNVASSAVSAIASNPAIQRAAEKAAEKAINAGVNAATNYVTGSGRRRTRLPASGRKRNTARGDIVRAIMIQRGVNLPTASRIVKQEGLY
jgi:hypothetical protein